MSDTKGTHLIRTLKEVALFPPHPPRKPTPLFEQNHKAMTRDENQPCASCGVRHSTLGDPAHNIMGSTQQESHHWIVEDSLANAIDLDHFNDHIAPGVAKNQGDTTTYDHPFTQDEMEAWIHGHRHNLLTLCDVCHRHPYVGIHAVTYPLWRAIRSVKPGYDLTGYHAASPQEAVALTNLPQTVGQALPPPTS